jgi:SAM-dependent methyltransferase
MQVLAAVAVVILALEFLHVFSYRILKRRMLRRHKWDLNVCCGRTDGGGVNADVVRHAELPNFVQIEDIYNLPFEDGRFETVLCSHTMEHVEDPDRFYAELRRVGKTVTLVLPPLWDVLALLNFWEHRWVFLTWHKEHRELVPRVRQPLSAAYQRLFGQRVRA